MASSIATVLSEIIGAIFPPNEPLTKHNARQFEPSKEICEKDEILIAMLNSEGHEHVPYCVCDPDKEDIPIIFSSDGFCEFTGYTHHEIEGRNCRFLQGEGTQQAQVDKIRKAIKDQVSTCVNLLNYRKDGSSFVNEFFLSPLRDSNNKVIYFIGVQCPVDKLGPGQMPSNVGWVYTQGSHE
mmetsp:Transcript_1248/g.1883  ORF Transcript_1248/g.1883 Transcript_1248/m.1883 type:complete len:182 (+) Transcript_1248:139-684(+)